MADIAQEVLIKADPKEVFAAVALPEGLTSWWANQVTGTLEVGTITEIRFDNGEVMKMEISELEVGKTLHWHVRSAPHGWEGSSITWDLTPFAGGTRLSFGHRNLTVNTSGYSVEQTRMGWEYFLKSLQSYLEEGEGMPYVN